MSALEAVASVLGLISVWLTVRQNLWCWPTGLVMVVLYAWIFYDVRLYSDAGLQVVYVFLQIYGWRCWMSGEKGRGGENAQNALPVTRLTRSQAALWLAVLALGTAGLGRFAASFDAALPYVDAFAAALSLIAQFLMARKVLESWWMWVAVDVVSLGMYASKELFSTMALYAAFLGLAVAGERAWRKSMQVGA